MVTESILPVQCGRLLSVEKTYEISVTWMDFLVPVRSTSLTTW